MGKFSGPFEWKFSTPIKIIAGFSLIVCYLLSIEKSMLFTYEQYLIAAQLYFTMAVTYGVAGIVLIVDGLGEFLNYFQGKTGNTKRISEKT